TSVGQFLTITVTAQRPAGLGGGTDTTYRGTVLLSAAGLVSGLPASYTFQPSDMGSHTFTVLAIHSGKGNITAVDSTSPALNGSATLTVTGFIAVGGQATGIVQILNPATEQSLLTFNPYPGYTGGVAVALGVITASGGPDI